MTVRELIERLQKEDPEALVVYFPDPHESSGYSHATDLQRVWVRNDGAIEMRYEWQATEGFVPAVG